MSIGTSHSRLSGNGERMAPRQAMRRRLLIDALYLVAALLAFVRGFLLIAEGDEFGFLYFAVTVGLIVAFEMRLERRTD